MVWPKEFLMKESKGTKLDYLECALWKLAIFLSNTISKKTWSALFNENNFLTLRFPQHLKFFFHLIVLLRNTKTLFSLDFWNFYLKKIDNLHLLKQVFLNK